MQTYSCFELLPILTSFLANFGLLSIFPPSLSLTCQFFHLFRLNCFKFHQINFKPFNPTILFLFIPLVSAEQQHSSSPVQSTVNSWWSSAWHSLPLRQPQTKFLWPTSRYVQFSLSTSIENSPSLSLECVLSIEGTFSPLKVFSLH